MKNVKKIIASIVTLALVGSTMMALPASAEVQESYKVSLVGTVGTTSIWDDSASIDVTGDGDYTLTFELADPTESKNGSSALILSTDINAFDFIDEDVVSTLSTDAERANATGITISVTSVTVDDGTTTLDYNFSGGDDSYCLNDDGSTIHLNLRNTWGHNCTDLDMDFNAEKNVTVNFTISGLTEALGGEVTEGTASEETPADTSDEATNGEETSAETSADATQDEATVTTVEDLKPGDSDGDKSIVSSDETSAETSVSEEETAIDYTLYESIIDAAGKVVADKGYNNLLNENGKLGYYLFDINGDGVKELIIAEDFSETIDGTTKLVSGYYDIYTIVDGEVVPVKALDDNGDKLLAVAANGYLSIDKDTKVALVDGCLVYVKTDDNSTKVNVIYVTGYKQNPDGSLEAKWYMTSDVENTFSQLNLYDYTDKTPLGGNKEEETTTNGSESATEVTTTTNDKSENPGTGDAGIGTVAIAFAVAGLSAIALRKKD